MEVGFVKDRLALMLDHFGVVDDDREAAKVRYPLREVLFLVMCATIAGCDDFDEIADWGSNNRPFLCEYSEFYHGIPCEDWLRAIINRIDPALFEACFRSWVASLRRDDRADTPDLIAFDGKSVRGSGKAGGCHKAGTAADRPLHLVSAWASSQRLVLAQEGVDVKHNECHAILAIFERLSIKGALVTIDAIATYPKMAQAILDQGGDYLLALKTNQSRLHNEINMYFSDPETQGLPRHIDVDKDHGRIETRTTIVSHDVDWMTGSRKNVPKEETRFPRLACLIKSINEIECQGKITQQTRYFIASKPLTPDQAAHAIRSHWGIESLHWVLDVIFKEDQSRLRTGHGAHNMALVRRLAFNLLRIGKGKRSMKTARKAAGWNADNLKAILNATLC
jgi:predicted transposase YbfD/YdcC